MRDGWPFPLPRPQAWPWPVALVQPQAQTGTEQPKGLQKTYDYGRKQLNLAIRDHGENTLALYIKDAIEEVEDVDNLVIHLSDTYISKNYSKSGRVTGHKFHTKVSMSLHLEGHIYNNVRCTFSSNLNDNYVSVATSDESISYRELDARLRRCKHDDLEFLRGSTLLSFSEEQRNAVFEITTTEDTRRIRVIR